MALNLDQLIYRFCANRYPIKRGCCLRDKADMMRLRFARAKRIKEEVKGFPYEVQKEIVEKMINKEMMKDAIS